MHKSAFAAAVLAAALALPALAHAQDVPPAPPDAAAPPPEATPPDGTAPATPPATPEPPPVTPPPVTPPPPEVTPPAAPKPGDKPAAKVYYDHGFTFLTPDEKFKLHLRTYVQMRFESDRLTASGSEFRSRFQVTRARLITDGNLFGPDLLYKTEFTLSDKGNPFLKDAYVDKKLGGAWLRAGQYKRPFNRQEITSDSATEIMERAITNDFSLSGRDIGVTLHNGYDKSPEGLEWAFGVFNGGPSNTERPVAAGTVTCTSDPTMPTLPPKCTTKIAPETNVPADFGPMVVARIGWNHGHIKGYSEADLEGGPLRFAVAASYRANFNNFPSGAVGKSIEHGAELDYIIKAMGFDSAGGVYLNKEPGTKAQVGFNVQGGYFVTPNALQVDARFAMTPHAAPATGKQFEVRLGFNDFFQGHDWKWVNDIGAIKNTGTGASTELQLRIGAQVSF